MNDEAVQEQIAIIGMAGRFPGAPDIDTLWKNLCAGKECLRTFTDEELRRAGVDERSLNDSRYVKRGGRIDGAELFDAAFFGLSPREASLTDPQHRIFLEAAWNAMEDAGYAPDNTGVTVGIYAGCGSNFYLINNLARNRAFFNDATLVQQVVGNDKDYLATRVAYKLNATGPVITVQTACSSSLVAVHLAGRSLLTGECDMAICGGSFVNVPRIAGFFPEEGDIRSPDGFCRPFDRRANGTMFGEGCAAVVLRRLSDAMAAGDSIYAVIKSSAVNNDGSSKMGFTAPSVDGQSAVVETALALADVPAESIGYVEAHGTGTPLGDPVEIAALTKAFRLFTRKKSFCSIGALKGNIGHLDAASGVAGLIKTALVVHHGKIPPIVNFELPNPKIGFENTPFVPATRLLSWPQSPYPRRATVGNLGVGGTNVTIVLEEPPASVRPGGEIEGEWSLCCFSARTPASTEATRERFREFSGSGPLCQLPSAARTLFNGRRRFPHRSFCVASSWNDMEDVLAKKDAFRYGSAQSIGDPSPVFMFSGQGSPYFGMGADIVKNRSQSPLMQAFSDALFRCSDIMRKEHGFDLDDLLFSKARKPSAPIEKTADAQPALFAVSYALLSAWTAAGVRPKAVIGHSIGELCGAVAAGALELKDGIGLVMARAAAMQVQPAGAMLSVAAPAGELVSMVPDGCVISLYNAPDMTVLSGPEQSIAAAAAFFEDRKIPAVRLHTSHAFHSKAMAGAVSALQNAAQRCKARPPAVPFISNVSGTYHTTGSLMQGTDYWVRHVLGPVHFTQGIHELMKIPNPLFIEIGPGNALCGLVRRHGVDERQTIASMRHPRFDGDDRAFLLAGLGKAWCAGLEVDDAAIFGNSPLKRAHVPGYSFDRGKYWVEPDEKRSPSPGPSVVDGAKAHSPDSGNASADVREIVFETARSLLGVQAVSESDDFFMIGGDSIWAARFASRLSLRFPSAVNVSDIFSHPKIGSIVEMITQRQTTNASSEIQPRIPVLGRSEFSLSPSQQRIWFLVQVDPASPAFNLAWTYEIKGAIENERLQSAFRRVCGRHRILKTVFPMREGAPRSVFKPEMDIPFSIQTAWSSKEAVSAAIKAESVRSFSLEQGPLVRGAVYRMSETSAVLAVYIHHIIADGWSMGIFLNDIARAYENSGFAEDPGPQFSDYVPWYVETLAQKDLSAHRDYWKNNLAGVLPLLSLSGDFPRRAQASYFGGGVPLSLTPEVSALVKELARSHGVTPFAALMAGFKVLLNVFTENQQDLVVGAPYANRPHHDTEGMLGFFLTMLPIRTRLEPEQTVSEYLRVVGAAIVEAFKFGDLPFEQIIQIVKPMRDVSYTPLFQTMLAFQNFPLSTVRLGNASASAAFFDRGATEFDLSLYLWENNGAFEGLMEYSTDLFSEATVRVMIETYATIMEAAARAPGKKLRELRRLSKRAFDTYVIDWNKTRRPVPSLCVHDLIAQTAMRTPDAVACSDGERELTYAALDRKAALIASFMQSKGIAHGSLVGICMERSIDMVTAMVAVLKVGAAYVPLDPAYPRERLAFMAQDAAIGAILFSGAGAGSFPDFGGTKIVVDAEGDLIESSGASFPLPTVTPSDRAYVLYTSGSTGKPKGVCITHGSAVNFIASMLEKPGIKAADVIAAVTTLSFDIAFLELIVPLCAGARVEILDRETAWDGNRLRDRLDRADFTIMQATPATWRLLLAAGWQGGPHLKALCGGEALQPDLAGALLPKVKELWNMYGPTETTVWSSCVRISGQDAPITLGRPIANTAYYVVNESGSALPPMAPGELLIAGKGLSSGYLNRPDLTNKNFIPNTIHPDHGPTVYKTGDLVRFRHEGTLEYLHRIDTQVKVRGFRIELCEIETALASHPSIKHCVASVAGGLDDVRLAAYYTVRPGQSTTQTDLRKYLRKSLPEYMVPQYFVEMNEFPLSPAGKVDRKALPAPIATAKAPPEAGHPLTPDELYLAQVWKTLLKVASVGKSDNFFDLGGHSLLCMRLISEIEKDKGIRLSPRVFLMNNLEQVAMALRKNLEMESVAETTNKKRKKWKLF
jgi:amino acid adenylation domain-containing protein